MYFFCNNEKKNSNNNTAQHSEQEPKRYWRPARKWRNIARSQEGK